MSSRALFDDDSSSDEDASKTTTPAAADDGDGDAPKRTIIKTDDDSDDDDDPMDEDKPAAATTATENEGDKEEEEEEETISTRKKPSTAELFGDDSDDNNPNEKSDGKAAADDSEDAKKPAANSSSNTAALFGDESSDDEDDNVDFNVVGSAAPARPKPAEGADIEGMTDGATGSSGRSGDVITKAPKPPQNATVLEAEHPSKSVSLHMTKLPNLVAIQPNAFDADTYDEKEEEEEYKGYVHNMIRWRYQRNAKTGDLVRDANEKLVRESNSRLVKWDDGSITLYIGKEAFDIQTVDSSSAKDGFAGLNGYMYLSQKATFSDAAATEGEEAEEKPGGTVLECIGPVASRLVAKPSSLQSESHKSLTVAVRQRTIKKARIAEYVTQEDPERLKAERIRTKDDSDKINARKRANSYRQTGGSRNRTPGMNRRYLEEDDDEAYDSINIRALKRRGAEDDMDDYGDDSDGDDDDGYNDTFRSRAAASRKRKKQEEEEEDEEELVFDEESDEEDVSLIKAHKKKKAATQNVFDDDDDED